KSKQPSGNIASNNPPNNLVRRRQREDRDQSLGTDLSGMEPSKFALYELGYKVNQILCCVAGISSNSCSQTLVSIMRILPRGTTTQHQG
ncbi:MAG: hypothetical protein ACKPKO_08635, partial [Candidatus Fonsibacter sp.]